MSSAIDPQAGQPTSTQAFEQSDRNPTVRYRGTDADGGPIAAPASGESRATEGAAPDANAGLTNYNNDDSADAAQNEGEREG